MYSNRHPPSPPPTLIIPHYIGTYISGQANQPYGKAPLAMSQVEFPQFSLIVSPQHVNSNLKVY